MGLVNKESMIGISSESILQLPLTASFLTSVPINLIVYVTTIYYVGSYPSTVLHLPSSCLVVLQQKQEKVDIKPHSISAKLAA